MAVPHQVLERVCGFLCGLCDHDVTCSLTVSVLVVGLGAGEASLRYKRAVVWLVYNAVFENSPAGKSVHDKAFFHSVGGGPVDGRYAPTWFGRLA